MPDTNYQLRLDGAVIGLPSGMVISPNEGDSYRIAYNEWLAAGNEPLPADPNWTPPIPGGMPPPIEE